MKIVCALTDTNHPGFSRWLKPSCVQHNLSLVPLVFPRQYVSHRLKDGLLLEYLKNCSPKELILFTDAYDTVMLSDEQEILDKFQKFNAPLVFSAEANCWPDPMLAFKYPAAVKDVRLKYLNSGGFIGEAGYIKDLIQTYYAAKDIDHSKFGWSNQYLWNQIYLREQKHIKLDHSAEIFYTLSADVDIARKFFGEKDEFVKDELLSLEKERISKDIAFMGNRLKYMETDSSPCHIHFNSPLAKHLMFTDFFNAIRAQNDTANSL